jgi:hypothetical protein
LHPGSDQGDALTAKKKPVVSVLHGSEDKFETGLIFVHVFREKDGLLPISCVGLIFPFAAFYPVNAATF